MGDVVEATLRATEQAGGVFNVGTGRETSVVELYDVCRRVSGAELEPEFAEARLGELARSVLDPSARRERARLPRGGLAGGRTGAHLGFDSARRRGTSGREIAAPWNIQPPSLLPAPGAPLPSLAAGVAALELVVIVVVVLAAFAKPFSNDSDIVAAVTPGKKAAKIEASTPAADQVKKQKSAPAPVAKLARNETSVIILNGNGIPGAADEAAGVVQSLRYLIAGTANAPRTDFARSLVMYRPGYKGEAMRLAKDVRVRRVVPLDGMRAAELQGAHVALILGRQ